jgi:hypothetical protein
MFFAVSSSVVMDCDVASGAELDELTQAVKKRKINAKKNLAACCRVTVLLCCILPTYYNYVVYYILFNYIEVISFFTT